MVLVLRSNHFITLIANQIALFITATATETHVIFLAGGGGLVIKMFVLSVCVGGLTEKIRIPFAS